MGRALGHGIFMLIPGKVILSEGTNKLIDRSNNQKACKAKVWTNNKLMISWGIGVHERTTNTEIKAKRH